jgi:hypothetical protein
MLPVEDAGEEVLEDVLGDLLGGAVAFLLDESLGAALRNSRQLVASLS